MARVNFDKGTQKDRIVEATWDVMMRDGLARTSMRAIAHEVGCSTGVLTHHFRDKGDILAVALDKISQEIAERVRDATQSKTGLEASSALAKGFLPSDKRGKRLWTVWIQFLAEAICDNDILNRHSRQYDWTRKRLMAYFETMLSDSQVSDNDIAIEADYFIALLDGLGVNALVSRRRYGQEKLSNIVQLHLTRILNTYQGE